MRSDGTMLKVAVDDADTIQWRRHGCICCSNIACYQYIIDVGLSERA